MIPFNQDKLTRIAKTEYVILLRDRGKLTLLVDPGMNRPWHSPNYQLAKMHASACDGEARTFQDAWNLLSKEYPGFEKDMIARIEHAKTDLTHRIVSSNGNSRTKTPPSV